MRSELSWLDVAEVTGLFSSIVPVTVAVCSARSRWDPCWACVPGTKDRRAEAAMRVMNFMILWSERV